MNSLEELLRRDEGERLKLYKDSLGYWTIGVGRLLDPAKGGGISKEESAFLLANDIKAKKSEVLKNLPWYTTLTEPRQAVIISMAFQLGIAGLLGFKNTLAKIKDGDYEGAAKGMLASKWARQTPERVKRLAKQMATNLWQ